MSRFSTLRFVSLLALGALVLHDLRYRIGYQEHADAALAVQGHAYLTALGALVGVLLAAALACFGALLLRARRTGLQPCARVPLVPMWAYSAASLGTIYVTQELLEGQLSAGHPAGLVGVVGHAGWVAFLLAIGLGALIALLLRGADAVIVLVSSRARKRRRATSPGRRPPRFTRRALDVVAYNLAGRAPPLPS